MSATPNKLTETFNQQVKSLIEQGIAANFAEVVRALDWNKSMMTEVSKGRKNVPVAVYRKFTEYYGLSPVQVAEEQKPGYSNKEDLIILLKQNNKLLEDQLNLATGELRHIAVMNFAVLKSLQPVIAKILAKVDGETLLSIAGKIDKATAETYKKVRQKGSTIDLSI